MKMFNRFALLSLVMLFVQWRPAFADPQIIGHVTIYKQKNTYACFPEIFIAEDGTVVVTLSARDVGSHYGGNSKNIVLISKDKGKTWKKSDAQYINPAFRTGKTSYSYPYSSGWKKVDEERASLIRNKGIEIHMDRGNFYYSTELFVRRTTNQGRTWEREAIELPFYSMLMTYNLSSFLKTRSGIMMRMFYGKLSSSGKCEPFLVRSTDNGRTWSYSSRIPALKETGFDETALVELEDGKILALLRPNPTGDQRLYVSTSLNTGKDWTPPKKTLITGLPANLITQGAYVVASYGYRLAPMGIRVRVFRPDGIAPAFPELVLRDDSDNSRGSDVGYPMTVSLGNSNFFTVYYITTDGITYVAGTRWRLTTDEKQANK